MTAIVYKRRDATYHAILTVKEHRAHIKLVFTGSIGSYQHRKTSYTLLHDASQASVVRSRLHASINASLTSLVETMRAMKNVVRATIVYIVRLAAMHALKITKGMQACVGYMYSLLLFYDHTTLHRPFGEYRTYNEHCHANADMRIRISFGARPPRVGFNKRGFNPFTVHVCTALGLIIDAPESTLTGNLSLETRRSVHFGETTAQRLYFLVERWEFFEQRRIKYGH